ncbi:hypothetical protein A2716_01255 [candidate division WWE3 bacterium RIFCSPHIGHO2_01_FULL_40_23]|uniref:Uncharacterized protein n=1 Tax=candidate division WWE3 bacterium RIFCSPLOWO2_01_FULL_41_18 TaxID=1802625 RepID=A0A1F4VDX5_UNCKA|nr:MAG: hypothetical protein A2716_01255 [candidate division WWE3 bacterium RIFCSPHIGHO2_01_FULL_40_23]OGC55364.1 MAG: hypothetical protein A3A78_00160 [candidate division WWE3 bacterium RIFCSPLOWO2_01_FULL_41_18]
MPRTKTQNKQVSGEKLDVKETSENKDTIIKVPRKRRNKDTDYLSDVELEEYESRTPDDAFDS